MARGQQRGRREHVGRAAAAPRPKRPSAGPPAWSPWLVRAILFALPIAMAMSWHQSQLARNGETGFPMDDPYIHFQFARNLATGHGFSFNPDVPTPGATSPLWVVLLAAGRGLGMPLESLALGLGVLLGGVAAVLTFEVALAAALPLAACAIAGLLVAISGRMTWAALSGMEITLATALFLLLVRLQQSRLAGPVRGAVLGAVAGLAATARPEMTLLGPLIFGLEAWRLARDGAGRRALAVLAPLAAAFVVVLLPYTLFCLATTGRPMPNTYYAKGVIARASDVHLAHYRATYLPVMYQVAYHDNLAFALLLVPGLALWLMRSDRRVSMLVALWPVAFWLYSLVVFPRHFSASRYTIPLIPAFALVSIEAVAWALRRVRATIARRTIVATAAAVLALFALRSTGEYLPVYLSNVDNILSMQVRMGRWVARHLPPGARVAANDVGAITYYGGRFCIDTVGLVSPDAITHLLAWWKRHGTVFPEEALPSYFRVVKPDFCILFPAWYPNLTRAPWLRYIGEFDYANTTGGGDRLVAYRVIGTPVGPLDAEGAAPSH